MKKSWKILLGLFVAILIFYFFYLPPLTKYRELKGEEERILRELAQRENQIKQLEIERDRLKNDVSYLEEVIRQELGLVKPGEIVYKFVPEESQTESPLTGMGVAGSLPKKQASE